MTTKYLVDPELVALLDQIPASVLTAETLGQTRAKAKMAVMASQASANLPQFSALSVSERFIPGLEGAPDVRVLVYLPTSVQGPLPALLWIHGGGYIMGSADAEDITVKSIVSAIGCAAVSVDYRLAPETPHPGPVEDCYTALKWLYTHADELGIDPNRIAVGGSSSGGGWRLHQRSWRATVGKSPWRSNSCSLPCSMIARVRWRNRIRTWGNSSGRRRPTALAGPLCWARNQGGPMFRPMLRRHVLSIWRAYPPPLSTWVLSICFWRKIWSMLAA